MKTIVLLLLKLNMEIMIDLASRVAQISGADSLILLSDVEWSLYKNPKINKNAKLIKRIKNIDKDIENISTKSVGRTWNWWNENKN